MTVSLDVERATLRLPLPVFESLVAHARGQSPDSAHRRLLVDAGVLEGVGVVDALSPAVDAIVDPLVQLSISVAASDGQQHSGTAWVSAQAAAFLLDAPGDEHDLSFVHPTMVPVTLARLTGLGPRPRGLLPSVRLPQHTVAALTAERAVMRTDALARLAQASHEGSVVRFGEALAQERWRMWTVQASWNGPEGPTERSVSVLDCVLGLAVVHADDDAYGFDPATPRDVWAILTMLLPDDDELSGT